tara:strand:- start:257 stop:391 length:135 start_codon:yes stop_codon:yes gene_type:complete
MKDGARIFAIMLITELKKQGQHKAIEIVLETLKELTISDKSDKI